MPSDPSTVRAMLVLLEKRGLVQRNWNPTDSRADGGSHCGGTAKVSATLESGKSIRSQMIDSLQPDEVETLVGLLRKIAASLNTERVSVG